MNPVGSDELCLSLSCWKLTENGEFVKKKKKKTITLEC